VKHRANPKFWQFYEQLPREIQELADKNFALLKLNPQHPSLHFKKVGRYWSALVGIHHRAAGVQDGTDLVWFWIGRHDEYEFIIGARR
jgi:hypothetical protein